MPHVHLLEGPVGAGKSTFAARLGREHSAPILILDDWMATLFRPDRPEADVMPWYLERKERCIAQIWTVAQGILEAGSDVVLELGLVQRAARWAFYARLEAAEIPYTVYVLDAPRDVRRARVRARNEAQGATFSMVVPDAIFEVASDAWEPPDGLELEGRDIQFFGEGV